MSIFIWSKQHSKQVSIISLNKRASSYGSLPGKGKSKGPEVSHHTNEMNMKRLGQQNWLLKVKGWPWKDTLKGHRVNIWLCCTSTASHLPLNSKQKGFDNKGPSSSPDWVCGWPNNWLCGWLTNHDKPANSYVPWTVRIGDKNNCRQNCVKFRKGKGIYVDPIFCLFHQFQADSRFPNKIPGYFQSSRSQNKFQAFQGFQEATWTMYMYMDESHTKCWRLEKPADVHTLHRYKRCEW